MDIDGEKGMWLGSCSFWRSHYLNKKCSHKRKIVKVGSEVSVGAPEFEVSVGHVSLKWKYRTRIQKRDGAVDGIY